LCSRDALELNTRFANLYVVDVYSDLKSLLDKGNLIPSEFSKVLLST